MKSVILSLVTDDTFSPLSVEKQLAISLVKSVGKNVKINKAEVVCWPLLAVRAENNGYYIFDETGKFSTTVISYVLQDYKRIVSSLENTSDETQVLELMKSIRWDDVKGSLTMRFDFVVENDLKNILKPTASQLPCSFLDKKLKDIDVQFILSDIKNTTDKISEEVNNLDVIKQRVTEIIAIIKGRRVEKRRQIEEDYDSKIRSKNDELKNKVNDVKKNIENEVKQSAVQSYSKLPDIEVLIAKAEIDKEAGFVDSVSSVNSIKERYLAEASSKINEVKEKYKVEIRRIRGELIDLNSMKNKDLSAIDADIKKLDELENEILAKLNSIQDHEKAILEKIRSLPKFVPFLAEDKIEIMVPLFVVETNSSKVVIPPQIYKPEKKGFLGGIFKKDPTDISENFPDGEIFVKSFDFPVNDNLRGIKNLVDKGLKELSEEGWNVRKSLDEYY
jgi:hypothetical protein